MASYIEPHQYTLKRSVSCCGVGLHTGRTVNLTITRKSSIFQEKCSTQLVNKSNTLKDGLARSCNEITISWNLLGINETAGPIPQVPELLPIAPNPSNGSPLIRFGLPEPAFVGICIFDISGRLVSEVSGDEYSLGYHEVQLKDLNSGIYFCRMISGDFIATQHFVVIE